MIFGNPGPGIVLQIHNWGISYWWQLTSHCLKTCRTIKTVGINSRQGKRKQFCSLPHEHFIPFKYVNYLTGTCRIGVFIGSHITVSYTHLRAHETKANLVCRLLLEK